MTIAPIFWPGSGSDPTGLTAYEIFEDDDDFMEDAPKVAKWVCLSLGYPIMNIELTDQQIYVQFETAIMDFSAQVNEFNIRENILSLQGGSTASSISQTFIKSNPINTIIELSQAYGTEAGSGGDRDWKTGFIQMTANIQEYDLQALWGPSESNNRIEIRRIFHDRVPAISRGGFGFGDATTGPSDGTTNLLGEFGWAGYDGGLNGVAGGGGAGQFIVMPIYETLLRTQAIEFNDIIRRSQYSFEIHNNKIRIMPRPQEDVKLWFQYTVKSASNSFSTGSRGTISDISNAPFTFIQYSAVNDVGRRWIYRYTLALCKKLLGRILSKYREIPIPDQQITMDGELLRQEGEREMEILYDQLRETLVEAGKQKQLEKMAENEEKSQEILSKVPQPFFIG